MKIIVSHDVDHLYPSDHFFKDLILEKLWVRSFIHLCMGKIKFSTFCYRLSLPFRKRMNRIDELMEFDEQHGIPSVFFFGMDNVLGMSYSQDKATPVIKHVMDNGFDVGVHGVNFDDFEKIKKEHDDFQTISQKALFGIRNHYVRFNDTTFEKQGQAGYIFGSTWFNKKKTELRRPYKTKSGMWEFPLHVMDGYVCFSGKLQEGIENTQQIILQAEEMGMPYCTILFHDPGFNDSYEPEMKKWYIKTVEFCETRGYQFISYRDAIKELEQNG